MDKGVLVEGLGRVVLEEEGRHGLHELNNFGAGALVAENGRDLRVEVGVGQQPAEETAVLFAQRLNQVLQHLQLLKANLLVVLLRHELIRQGPEVVEQRKLTQSVEVQGQGRALFLWQHLLELVLHELVYQITAAVLVGKGACVFVRSAQALVQAVDVLLRHTPISALEADWLRRELGGLMVLGALTVQRLGLMSQLQLRRRESVLFTRRVPRLHHFLFRVA